MTATPVETSAVRAGGARALVRPDSRGAAMLAIAPPLVADAAVIDDLLNRVDRVLDRVSGWLRASN